MQYVHADVRDGWFYCGHCGSPDDWIETPTGVGCASDGTFLHPDQLDAFYDVER